MAVSAAIRRNPRIAAGVDGQPAGVGGGRVGLERSAHGPPGQRQRRAAGRAAGGAHRGRAGRAGGPRRIRGRVRRRRRLRRVRQHGHAAPGLPRRERAVGPGDGPPAAVDGAHGLHALRSVDAAVLGRRHGRAGRPAGGLLRVQPAGADGWIRVSRCGRLPGQGAAERASGQGAGDVLGEHRGVGRRHLLRGRRGGARGMGHRVGGRGGGADHRQHRADGPALRGHAARLGGPRGRGHRRVHHDQDGHVRRSRRRAASWGSPARAGRSSRSAGCSRPRARPRRPRTPSARTGPSELSAKGRDIGSTGPIRSGRWPCPIRSRSTRPPRS